jgi:TonB family protein
MSGKKENEAASRTQLFGQIASGVQLSSNPAKSSRRRQQTQASAAGIAIGGYAPPPTRPQASTPLSAEDAKSMKAPATMPRSEVKRITISGGVLQGNVVNKVQPAYPSIAKSAKASGAVQVQIVINEAGTVIDAQAIGGHPLLRAAAVEAAKQWSFQPTKLSGVPVKVQGVLAFNFALGGKTSGDVSSAPATLLPDEGRRRESLIKLHPSIQAVVLRLEDKTAKPAAVEAKFVHDGKAEVEVWLTDKSDATIDSLKNLGFEVVLNPQSSKLVIGRLPIEKLMALAEMHAVRYIGPAEVLSQK